MIKLIDYSSTLSLILPFYHISQVTMGLFEPQHLPLDIYRLWQYFASMYNGVGLNIKCKVDSSLSLLNLCRAMSITVLLAAVIVT